jgi:hypothetical protein
MNKSELLEALEDGRQELVEMLQDLPDEDMVKPGVCGEWSIKDILAHLAQWEGQTVTLLFQARQSERTPTTAHFGKETVDEVNQRWYEANRDRPLERVWEDWIGVRKQMIRRVSEFSEKELTDPQRYPWSNGRPLWQIIADSTFDHEDEHADGIREWLEHEV